MKVIYNTQDKTISFDVDSVPSHGGNIDLCVHKYDEVIDLKNMTFGLLVRQNEQVIYEYTYPPKGVNLIRTDQEFLTSVFVKWSTNSVVEIEAFLLVNGIRYDHSFTYEAVFVDENGNIIEQYEVEVPDPEPTETELLQAQIDALLILLAQDAT